MRRGFTIICLLVLAIAGFYVGRLVAPGVLAHGAGLARTPGVQSPVSPGQQTPGGTTGSSKNLWIDVDVTAQKVRVMDGDKVYKEITCSTGVKGAETPLGTFEIQSRGEWFFNDKYQEGARYWVSFKDWGVYLFHSVVMDKDRKVIPAEEAKLGSPASHGCIRMPLADAKWIYDNIPGKAKAVIHE